ncbi:unnamed protein product [Parnassius apollo]|uniref:(apollo) hypothetical protein n=1 Tax=Parnassius apollo TaxID=110799 RepID=A0A8S3Y1X0_PARAO|nr:unnamed protein product [Parnassius apollo]
MKKGRSLKLLNIATNVIRGPDSNPLNSAETEVEKSDSELVLLSRMQNKNVRDSELLLPTSNIVQDDLNKFPTAEETIENKENLLSHKKISRELKTSELSYYCEEESPKLSPIASDQYIFDYDDSVKDKDDIPPTDYKRNRSDSDTDSQEEFIDISQNVIIPDSPEQEENDLLYTKKRNYKKEKEI